VKKEKLMPVSGTLSIRYFLCPNGRITSNRKKKKRKRGGKKSAGRLVPSKGVHVHLCRPLSPLFYTDVLKRGRKGVGKGEEGQIPSRGKREVRY